MNRLRQILTVFLVGLTFFVMQALGYGNALIAQAEETVESPVGIYYKGTPSDTSSGTSSGTSSETSNIQNDNKLVEKAGKNLKETADNVKEKVNNFGESVSGSSDGNVKSPVGIYYKGTPSDTSNIQDDKNLIEKATKKVKETADNLHAAVDLDENATTPEANYYKAQPQTNTTSNGNNPIEQAKESLKKTAENVTEKLNLNEELPRSTKEFLNITEKRVEKTVAPVTGTKEGYYQESPQVR